MRVVCKFHDKTTVTERRGIGWKWVIAGLCAAIAALLLPVFSRAQQLPKRELEFFTQPYTPPVTAAVRRKVFLVEINAVVRNAQGAVVGGLKEQDFKVYDNGKEQKITQFKGERAALAIMQRQLTSTEPAKTTPGGAKTTAATPERRNVALFFDDLRTPFGDLSYARRAAEKFVREDVDAGDKVGVFTASGMVAQNFTSDRQKLLKAIASIRPEKRGAAPAPLYGCAHYALNAYRSFLIIDRADTEVLSLYTCKPGKLSRDASVNIGGVYQQQFTHWHTADEVKFKARRLLHHAEHVSAYTMQGLSSTITRLAEMPGQRIVIMISSGFFTASMGRNLDTVAGEALHAGVIIDSLDAKGLLAPGSGGGNANASPFIATPFERVIHEHMMAEEDGAMSSLAMDTGGTFFHNRNDIANGLGEMAAVPEVSYLIAFTPSHLKDNGGYHHLKVKVTTPGSFNIRTRPGYFAPPRPSRKNKKGQDKVDPEVLKTNDVGGFPVGVKAQAGRLPSGKTGMLISLHLDPRDLKFRKQKGRHWDQLNLVVALFSPAGKFVTGERGLVNMALKGNTLEGLSQRGLNAHVVLQAPEGHYRLRVVMEDAQGGKLFATTKQASIP